MEDEEQLQVVSRTQAVSRRVLHEGRISRVVDYFGGSAPFGGAQAYLVQQKNYAVRPHFHPVDQFQILFGGPGCHFGRRPIGAGMVHYADAFTVYGPLTGGDPPLRYFTLRADPTDAMEYMPESRGLLPGGAGRSLHHDLDPLLRQPAAAGELAVSTLLHDERDALDVSFVNAGAGAGVRLPEAGPRGRFFLVLTGSVEAQDATYPEESVGWQPPGGGGWIAEASSAGARLLVLSFGRGDSRRLRKAGHA